MWSFCASPSACLRKLNTPSQKAFDALTRPLAVLCRLLLGGVIGAAATCKGPASLGQTLTGLGLPLPSCGEEDLSYATDEYLKELALTDPTAAAELLTKKTEWEEKKAAEVRLPESARSVPQCPPAEKVPLLQEAKKAEEAAAKHQADLEAAEKIHADIAAKEAAAKGQADGVDCQGYWSACSAKCGASIMSALRLRPRPRGRTAPLTLPLLLMRGAENAGQRAWKQTVAPTVCPTASPPFLTVTHSSKVNVWLFG